MSPEGHVFMPPPPKTRKKNQHLPPHSLNDSLVLNPLNQTRFNNATGERIYRFIEGNPVFSASANSQVISTNSNETVSFIAHGMQNPVHAVNVAPSAVPQMMHPGGAAMAPLPYQTVATVATPATERGIKIGGKEEYYIRSTYKKGSWMWK